MRDGYYDSCCVNVCRRHCVIIVNCLSNAERTRAISVDENNAAGARASFSPLLAYMCVCMYTLNMLKGV